MERNDGIIRWCPNPLRDEFMCINLNYRTVQMYRATGHVQPGRFDYRKRTKHSEFPPLSAHDWSPSIPGLVAMGTSGGHVNLLRVDDDFNQTHMLPLKLARACHAVAFNTTGLLAVGLERARNDGSLQIWDLNHRLAGWDPKKPGWEGVVNSATEPKKMDYITVTSLRFFEDQPQTLVAGIKQTSVKIYDLRDPSSVVIEFKTKCNNNIAIDYADTNYFASSSLEYPGVIIWDRRAGSRAGASPMYVESFEAEEVPWGAALKLDRAIDTARTAQIRQLRYCRDQRGTLGVLSNSGQLQVFNTGREFVEPGSLNDVGASPELLEVKKSHDLKWPYDKEDHEQRYEDRIVSFDWVNMRTSKVPGRVVALKANGSFDILGMPAPTAGLLGKVIPWRPPHCVGKNYSNLMNFKDPMERERVLGPLFATEAKEAIPLFGPERFTPESAKPIVYAAVKKALESTADAVIDLAAAEESTTIRAGTETLSEPFDQLNFSRTDGKEGLRRNISKTSIYSSQEQHDRSHYSANSAVSSRTKNSLIVNTMLRRAKAGYVLNATVNKLIVQDDQWLHDAWEWIEGAGEAAEEGGMTSGALDLAYMGVYTVWNNRLGDNAKSRLIESSIIPDGAQWEHLIATINKRENRPAFEGVATGKPQHRQLCLAMCGLSKRPEELDEDINGLEEEGKFTTAAAWSLFEGSPKRAVGILKKGGSDLLFIAMSLDMRLNNNLEKDGSSEDWTKDLDKHPQMANDPYLRAIYRYITSGNWISIANETALPLRDRVGVALRHFSDRQLTDWLSEQMVEAAQTGHIEAIILSGITDPLVDILAKYVEKFVDFQTPILIMSFCHPRYIADPRVVSWRKAYQDFLNRRKEYILRVKFDQQSTIKSRGRGGRPTIKSSPRQVTVRCLRCDKESANDLASATGNTSATSAPMMAISDERNPLAATGINAGLCCPKCGAHLARCAVCLEIVGVPRSDRPELSHDPNTARMAHFPTFCMKCKHVSHMDHAVAWFGRHMECPVAECRCQCNERLSR
ncbi:hypothetical protein BJ878DRAFT_504147 [Calycina marina]|uniref:Uncharacterized protein n=1 Tax=Calycina marina TaxID=1763456 RepID=A0A9P7Z3Y6_9HELO|nr:hypothetical protein BJ878DRAFT_504147 [Calycina marina]